MAYEGPIREKLNKSVSRDLFDPANPLVKDIVEVIAHEVAKSKAAIDAENNPPAWIKQPRLDPDNP